MAHVDPPVVVKVPDVELEDRSVATGPDEDKIVADSNVVLRETQNPQDQAVQVPAETLEKGPEPTVRPDNEPYSIFTTNQKRAIVLVTSLAGFFSPLTGAIYYPAIPTIANDLHVSTSKINLTVTTYLIVQGLAPMMIAGFSDNCGRRPAYIICFVVYILANLALALENNYVALLVLRMLQSAGSSGTISLAQGVVGDLITSSERGSYIAFSAISGILGPTLSPILGGLLSQYLGWHSVFWFLLILASCFFVGLLLFVPETGRKVVADGSVPPPKLNANLTDSIRHANRAKAGIPIDVAKQTALRADYRLASPNPLSTLIVLTDPETFLILLGCGLPLAAFYAISTGASAAFHTLYGLDDLHVSLMFLPIGAGGVLAAYTTGKLVDWNYRRHAKLNDFPVVRNRQQDLIAFPIEKARIEIALPLLWLGGAGVLGYGWLMDHRVNLAGPAILLFVMGYGLAAAFQVLNVLMVDIYPGKTATAAAANNIVRCELGAAATAALGSMVKAMGDGWAYTLLALLFLGYSPVLLLVMARGMGWRKAKREKGERRKREKEEKEKECGNEQEVIAAASREEHDMTDKQETDVANRPELKR